MTPVTNLAGIYREQASPVCKQTRMMASILSFSVSSAARPLSSNLSKNLRCLRAGGATIASAYTYPSLSRCFADGGYAGQKLATTIAHIDRLVIEIVRRSDAHRFVVLPRRWVVERTIAWLNRCRRLAKDWEASIASAEAWLIIASIRRMPRRIAKLEL